MPKIQEIVAAISKRFGIMPDNAMAVLHEEFPELFEEQDTCLNCGASMMEYVYNLDCLDALLVYGMGQIVKHRLSKGMQFKEANQVHLQSELNTYYSVSSRSTQCSKLGLITKVLHEDGSHNTKAGWLITARGFALLRGEAVPKKVRVFRNKIEDRFDELITIHEAFNYKGRSQVEKYPDISTFNASEWQDFASYEIGPVHQGNMFNNLIKQQ